MVQLVIPGFTLSVAFAIQVFPRSSVIVSDTGVIGFGVLYICVVGVVYAVKLSPKFQVDVMMLNDGEPTILNSVDTPVQTGEGFALIASGA